MNLKHYNLQYEDTINYYELAKQLYNNSSYQKALVYLDQILDLKPPYLGIYLLKSECLTCIKDYEKALEIICEGLRLFEYLNDKSIHDVLYQIKLIYQRYKIYLLVKNNIEAKSDLESIKKLIGEYNENQQNQDIFGELLKQFDIKLSVVDDLCSMPGINQMNKTLLEEREIQAKKVWDFFLNCKDTSIPKENSTVHVISMTWFNKWKNYTNFHKYSHEKVEVTHNGIEDEFEHPGCINQIDILDKNPILIDPNSTKDYTNYVMRLGLQENQDFVIVSNDIWEYLYSIYGGISILRNIIIINNQFNQKMVEIWLKKINVILIPMLTKSQNYHECQIKTLYLSKNETIKDLKDKITRIYNTIYDINPKVSIYESRLWKLDPKVDYEVLIDQFTITTNKMVINAKLLKDSNILENEEIADNDIVICEYKIYNEWSFKCDLDHDDDNDRNSQNQCGFCKKISDRLSFCQCMNIKYCNQDCQKKHLAIHREKCNAIMKGKDKSNDITKQFNLNLTSKFMPNSRNGLTGLQNLGNTCFMNSSLQCLSNIWELTQFFLTNSFIKDLNQENKLGTGGRLAVAYSELIKQIWHGTDPYVSPWDIKRIIGQVASQFCGFNQQDSQEFLCYILDGLHEDLNRIKKKPFIETLESNNRPDEIVAFESWKNHLKRNQSVIVDLIHGQFKSKLICPDCSRISITFDPYMNISLPIPSMIPINLPLYFIFKDSRNSPYKIELSIPSHSPGSEIIKKISKIVEVDEKQIEINLLKDQRIIESNTLKFDAKSLYHHTQGTVFAYETQNELIDGSLTNSIDPDSHIRFEILPKLETNSTYDDLISFTRILYLKKTSTIKDLHLQVYFIMRNFVNNYVTSEKDSVYAKNLVINLDELNLNNLELEYTKLWNFDENPGRFYNLVYCKQNDMKKTRQKILFDNEVTLDQLFQFNNKPNVIELVFNKTISKDKLKLNKCQQLNLPSKFSSKEQKPLSIYECIDLFTKPELLDKDNLWYCNICKDHKQATKTMEIYNTPKILILHLKRFKTNRVNSIGSFYFPSSSSKITTLIDFPIEGLDLTNYLLGKYDDNEPPIYDLFAISNHYGGMGGGHYTAYAKNHLKNIWYDFDDHTVTKQDSKELVTEAAYILFYKRREKKMNENGYMK